MPVRAAHCLLCAPTRRAVDRVVGDVKIATVEACDCTCRGCTRLAILYGHRPKPVRTRHEAIFGERVKHPISGKRMRLSASSPRELESYVRLVETLRTEYRIGMRSQDDVLKALRRLFHGSISFEVAAVEYMERTTLAKNTRTRTATFLKSLPAEMRARDVDSFDKTVIGPWLETLTLRGLREGPIRLAWWTLRAIIGYAVERGHLHSVPWGTWQPKIRSLKGGRREREALRTPAELVQLLRAAHEMDEEREAKGDLGQLEAKIAAAAMLGLRQEEIAGLRWPDVDTERQRVRIVRQGDGGPTKTRREKVLVALPELFEVLAEHAVRLRKHRLYKKDGPVFPGPESTPWQPRKVELRPSPANAHAIDGWRGHAIDNDELRRAVTRAGLPDPKLWSAHSLKDSFATLEGQTYGNDLRALGERTGHKTISSLCRYLRTRSRGPVMPGFQLPPRGSVPLLAPSSSGTTASSTDPLTAASRTDGAERLERGAPRPPALAEGPSVDATDPAARGTLEEVATLPAPVNVAGRALMQPPPEEAHIVDAIASLIEPQPEVLTARPELVSDRSGPAAPTGSPAPIVTTQKAKARGGGLRKKHTTDDQSVARERSASLSRGTVRSR
jgi:integrase